ncbi:MAG: beta-ketoacyl-ACP synthase II [Lachnospiraceae bacterium]|nr:beta-ketoacyl-ACP synthase II [Lachnospiraceae bacterium]
MNRVVITGMGIISPVGNDIDTYWESLKNGKCGIAPLTRFENPDIPVRVAAEVKDFDPMKYYETKTDVRHADLTMQYAVAAAEEAVSSSGISGNVDPARFGVYIGSGIGGMTTFLEEHNNLLNRGPGRVSPYFIPKLIANMPTGVVSIRHGAKGPTLPIVTACATSTNTIGEAFHAIRYGYADVIIAGGTEASINELGVAGFVNCKALSLAEDPNAASLPFDKRRGGFVMGEGAAIVILEEYEHAKARNAKILAEVAGYGNTADAYHMTAPAPDGEGAIRAIRLAVEEAELKTAPEKIYFNAHGTGTHMNDLMETQAVKAVFKEDAYKLHVSSTKSMTAHMLGATGAAEAIAGVLAMNANIVPPTINLLEPDEELDLDYTPNKAVETLIEAVISTSLGFGGHNGCIVLKKI